MTSQASKNLVAPSLFRHIILVILCLYLLTKEVMPYFSKSSVAMESGGYGFMVFLFVVLVYNLYRIFQKRRYYQQQLALQQQTLQHRIEKQVLSVAARFQGRISPEELSMHSELSLTQAKQQLDSMVRSGLAQELITEQGVIIYAFSGLMVEKDKAGAKSAMEL